ncbi:hypothetical protein K439DRAFT_1658286 [Ramaria rubella]|nr:hypothetical protein K439DRAFT_1658286 [Ramaria rubella]
MLSFSDELDTIWKKNWAMITFVFLVVLFPLYPPSPGNRSQGICLHRIDIIPQQPWWLSWSVMDSIGYYRSTIDSPSFTGFFDNTWTPEPFGFGIPLIAIPGFLLILRFSAKLDLDLSDPRVYALYGRNFYVLVYLGVLLVAQVAVGVWQFAFPGEGPVMFPDAPGPVFHGCLYTAAPSLGAAAGAYIVVDLFFDVSIFAFTMAKTWKAFWSHRGPGLLRRISQDGAMYFVMIFTLNSVWLFMVLFATPTLKYITPLPAIMLDVTMINRLTMNLRGGDDKPSIGPPDLEELQVARLSFTNATMTLWTGYPTNPFSHTSEMSLAIDRRQDYELTTIVE